MQPGASQLIQDLLGDGLSHVARFSADGDKIMRLHAKSAVIENGFVFVPEEAPWLAAYVSELTTFPCGCPTTTRTRRRRRWPGPLFDPNDGQSPCCQSRLGIC